mmetsp:Transcript_34343/g.83065  ORF Transcript_34343/g.83065 Transcript_34343/m.83065 type:complete len:222 (+) Transcript_34343:111-776(+)|eukprot:CAMPEP_0181122634 /NCGR_PEP_ID=MMETSP1071-20121207/25424_1 /TAXON_ID=35127 /ORGANISM="Thalassiosira sp., Strain NH16" /LENGTH=221 /DNA_ID=CAMNT_0023207629 /DNA_START=45 /DNA_END=710 /DNA_ORIENTATION=+
MAHPKQFTELIGTAILVFTIQVASSDLAPLAIGSILISIVFAGGPISGAHYNPAVSLAIALRGGMSFPEMVTYMTSQIAGGILGGWSGGIVSASFSEFARADDASLFRAMLAESILAFVLCFVVLCVATNAKAADNHYYGLAIGLVVASGAATVGPISGGAFNPAVALGLSVSGGFSNLFYALAVSGANLAGGVAAAGAFRVAVPEEDESAPVGENAPLNA